MVTMYETAEAKTFKKNFAKYVTEEVKKQQWDIKKTRDRHHYMDTVFYFNRTDMDEQNYYKILCDAMNGIVYIDDSKVLTRCNKVYYDNKNPRIEILIHEVDYIGIFNSGEELDTFKNTYCTNCSRNKRNCSILNKAMAGNIQEEITRNEDNMICCSKYKIIK